jgi:hypothetical protein
VEGVVQIHIVFNLRVEISLELISFLGENVFETSLILVLE